jgi:uncharacterized Zn-binding protein involved in type VI secretion
MSLTTSVMGDKLTHGATIITGSPTRKVNGQPVARLGDMVDCPIHGKNPIVQVTGGMPMTDGRLTAHETAKAACGAVILPSIYNTPSPASGLSKSEEALVESDDSFEEDGVGGGGGAGASPEAAARSRALMAGAAGAESDSSPTSADGAPITRAVPASCRDIPENAPDGFRLSPSFTLRDLSSGAACARSSGASSGAVIPNKGYSRAEIICNLRHLAMNTLEPIAQHYGRKSMLISSGFRHNSNGSDHNIGSAVDIQFFFGGQKADGRKLDEIEKYIINTLKVPFTQIIHENNSWIHFACRKDGNNSGKRICWWAGGAYNSGYRY